MKKDELIPAVLEVCRAELCARYPGFHLAFAWLPYAPGTQFPIGTDGSRLYASEAILPMYAENPAAVRRGLLHLLLHCLQLHILPPAGADRALWSLACDIAAEREIGKLGDPRLETENPLREQVLSLLPERLETPSEILTALSSLPFPQEELAAAFRFDDHRLWWEETPEAVKQNWRSLQGGSGTFGSGIRGSAAGGDTTEFSLLTYDPRDYRPLLRRYMVPGEETELDEECFDYIYYDIGMRQFDRTPLLEPLEQREVWRLDELVIAIDTSSSCDEQTVSRFLREVYGILTSQENFFRRMQVVLLQCDCVIQDKLLIRSQEEWLDAVWNLKIHGRGGTDFRPVFREIEAMRRQGILKKPRALLYFTDGDGAYPSEPPDYETVFILAGKTIHPELLPKWAVIKEVL